MPEFKQYHFSDDEEIVFGPARKAEETRLGVNREGQPGEVTHTQMRKVAITNQRIVIEKPGACITIPNKDVRLVSIQQLTSDDPALSSFTILDAKSRNGQTVKLLIPGVPVEKIELLRSTFPNATIDDQKGLVGRILRWLG